MEFAEVTVKESPGLCRCCLSEGCYKDLGTEYTWMNDTEVYAEMLLDCFDIGITQHNDGPNGQKRLICEVCITRLRDACNFKKQVLDSEKKFIDMLGRGDFRPEKQTVLLPDYSSDVPMKAEAIEEVTIADDYDDPNVEFLDDIDFTEDEELVKSERKSEPKPSTSVSKRGRPKKTDEPPEKKPKMKPKTKIAKGGISKVEASSKSSLSHSNQIIKDNVATILQHSSVIPFRWHKQFFMCFYCHLPKQTFETLKEHISTEHKTPNIKPVVALMKKDEKVKVDITTLACKLCEHTPKDLNALIDHLKTHGKLDNDCEIGVIPFRLTGAYQCAICNERFQYFIKLNHHMNKHYGHYVCDVCGKSFLSGDRLRAHALLHSTKFPCTLCSETFQTALKRSNHAAKVHDKRKQYKCYYCSESFSANSKRTDHLKSSHGIDMPVYDCPVCKRNFRCCSRMQHHLKTVHAKTAA